MTSGGVSTTIINRSRPSQFANIPGRHVFAWYICYEYVYSVYNAPIGNAAAIAGYVHDIQDAQATGIDGFALFYINRVDMINSVTNMFLAAQQVYESNPAKPRFLLFMSAQAVNIFTSAVTATGSGACTFTWTANPLANGQTVLLAGSPVPTGFTAGTTYYVVNQATNTFQLAATVGGAAIASSSTGTSVTATQGAVNQSFPGTSFNWISHFVKTFASSPNYYHYNGRAVLATFLGLDQQPDLTNIFASLASAGINTFYVPSIFDQSPVIASGNTLNTWGLNNIGSLNFWTGTVPSGDIAGTNTMSAVCAANGKPITINLSGASYWSVNASPSAGAYFEHYGGEGPASEWANAIATTPAPLFVLETTWNDWTESYTSPVNIPNVPTVSSGYSDDALLMPHSGYAELRKYYANWYRTGVQPIITKDVLIYFYRIAAQAANTFSPPPIYTPSTIPDDLFVTTRLTLPATLSVSTGGTVTTYAVPAGVANTRIAFSAGVQLFQVIRNGAVIISIVGPPVVATLSANDLMFTTGVASIGLTSAPAFMTTDLLNLGLNLTTNSIPLAA
jgi:Glycosyl hydrolase family 71